MKKDVAFRDCSARQGRLGSSVSGGGGGSAHTKNGYLDFGVTFLSLILSVYDFSSDFIVAVETTQSDKLQTLYGNVIIYEKTIG